MTSAASSTRLMPAVREMPSVSVGVTGARVKGVSGAVIACLPSLIAARRCIIEVADALAEEDQEIRVGVTGTRSKGVSISGAETVCRSCRIVTPEHSREHLAARIVDDDTFEISSCFAGLLPCQAASNSCVL